MEVFCLEAEEREQQPSLRNCGQGQHDALKLGAASDSQFVSFGSAHKTNSRVFTQSQSSNTGTHSPLVLLLSSGQNRVEWERGFT